MMQQSANVDELTRSITDEIFKVLGFSDTGKLRRYLGPLFHKPASRFAQIAASFDQMVAQSGIIEAARWAMPNFVHKVEVHGTENIPPEGPLLIAANHPGTCDSLVIVSQIQRPDLKIVATGVPFTHELRSTAQHLIYTARQDIYERMKVVRAAIRHLKGGGAVLIFPGGRIEPDPSFLTGADQELERWSPSVELMLRRAPQTRVLVTIVSGVLSKEWMRHPLIYLKKKGFERQRIAEFLQVIQMMVNPRSQRLDPQVTFSQPVLAEELSSSGSSGMLAGLIAKAREMLEIHVSSLDQSSRSHFSTPSGS